MRQGQGKVWFKGIWIKWENKEEIEREMIKEKEIIGEGERGLREGRRKEEDFQ